MSTRLRSSVPAFLQLAAVLLAASPCLASWGPANKDYGGSLNMQLYTPSQVAASPAILVAIHYCTGTANSAHGWFDSAADKNGFYIIAPDAGKNCFDSSATRSGDRADIVKMVQYVLTQKSADKSRVFSAGLSSGGCMTNTLLAIYPDVFAGGSALPGFPAGGWPAGDTSCTKCGSTPPNNSAKQWGDIARNAFSYSGTRPCVQEWVGGADEYNFNGWLPSVVLQFTDLMSLGSGTSGSGGPSGWTRTVYKDSAGNVRLETNLGPSSQKHDLSSAGLFGYVISFLGLDKASGACGITTAGGGSSTGGSTNTGGSTSTGGKAAGGASSGAGGTTTAGGASSSGTGGTATGGAASGGATTAGTSSGGTITSNGGATSMSGGTSSANGGTATASGGSSSTPSGGSGTTLSGGATAAGGASTSTSGGTTAGVAGSATGGSGGSDSGCSCSTAVGHEQNVGLAGLVGLALCAGFRARKRDRRNASKQSRD